MRSMRVHEVVRTYEGVRTCEDMGCGDIVTQLWKTQLIAQKLMKF